MSEMTICAENVSFPVDDTKINRNELVVGGTGTGKTFSYVYPKLLHTFDESLVIPVVKTETMDFFAPVFKERGYEVEVLDFCNPQNGTIGYDPLDYIRVEKDATDLAGSIVLVKDTGNAGGHYDPYWDSASQSTLVAEILLAWLNGKSKKKDEAKASFADVLKIQELIRQKPRECDGTNLDEFFKAACEAFPESSIRRTLKTFQQLPAKTLYTVLSTLNTCMDRLFSDEALQLMKMKRKIDFRSIGKKKTVLFIQVPNQDMNMLRYINIFYRSLFKELMDEAKNSPGSRLPLRVHIILDDFAVAGEIKDFAEYISIFRAAGISVSILLQAESQLAAMYGEYKATTIINNADTYIFTGGVDLRTCDSIARRMNKMTGRILSLKLEEFAVFRRGETPVISRRYQTLNDPIYKEIVKNRDDIEI